MASMRARALAMRRSGGPIAAPHDGGRGVDAKRGDGRRDDLYAAMPPLEAKKALFAYVEMAEKR